jgi:hypothetical protein
MNCLDAIVDECDSDERDLGWGRNCGLGGIMIVLLLDDRRGLMMMRGVLLGM